MNRMNKKALALSFAGLVATGLMAGPAGANSADVIKQGSCSIASDWKLTLSPEDGQVEVDFEVDQNVVGDTWKVQLADNGAIFFSGKRVTQAPSGSFDVTRLTANQPGTDTITARAKNVSTGEVCQATVSV